MIKIGITGGIGSGKSTVCKVFELLGVPVYYADDEAKRMLEDEAVKQNILQLFGNEVLDESKSLSRKRIAEIVFKDEVKLEQLNSIIHPAVAAHFLNWLNSHAVCPYVLKEAAILFESGASKQVDKVITVVAPPELRIKRVTQRDNISAEQVMQRMKNQVTDEEKIKRSEFVIHNDEHQLVIPQVIAIHDLICRAE